METKYSINGILFTQKQIDVMGIDTSAARRVKNDPASLSLTGTQTAHGPSGGGTSSTQAGLFSDGRIRPQRFSAMARPRTFLQELPLIASDVFNELTEIVTGQLADSGTDADGFCGNPPIPGNLKVMAQNRLFGNYFIKSNLNAIPLVGQRLNYSDVPAEILNAGPSEFPYMPEPAFYQFTDSRSQLGFEFYKMGTSLERSTTKILWNGIAGANGTQGDGWFLEPAGLDSLVKTGYVDAITLAAAPAADSDVINWGGGDIGGNTTTGANFVETVHDQYYARVDLAEQLGMGGTVFAFVMRKELFRKATEVWACSYATYRCRTNATAGLPVESSGMEIQTLRNEMVNGQYLLIDGQPVPVIFDEGIAQERFTANPVNVLQSDMYLMPLSWNGRPLTYMQYFKMDNPYAVEFATYVNPNKVKFVNNGLFAVAERDNGFCMEYLLATRMRPILETPFLAGRIDNITYSYSASTRVADPATTYLYKNGGRTYNALNNGI